MEGRGRRERKGREGKKECETLKKGRVAGTVKSFCGLHSHDRRYGVRKEKEEQDR